MPALVVDDDGWLRFANAAAQSALGVAPEPKPPVHISDVLEGWLPTDANSDASAAGPAAWPKDMELIAPSGDPRLVSVFASDVTLDAGRGQLVFFRDAVWTHEPLDLHARLRQHEDRLALATDAARIGMFDRVILSDDPTPPYWTASMRHMLGYPMEADAEPDWFLERVHPLDKPRMIEAIEAANAPEGDGRVEVEVRWQHPDGHDRYLLIRSSTLFADRQGLRVSTRSIGVVMDITERRRAEEALRLRSEILDVTPDLVGISAVSGEVVYLNRAGRALLGLPESGGLETLSLERVHPPEVIARLVEQAVPTADRQGAWSAETEVLTHEGRRIPMSQVVLAHRRESDEVTHYSTVARDLSRERELEAQFLQAQKMEAIGRLAGGVAHDFNNLLSVIMASCELASLELPDGDPAGLELSNIQAAAERAAALTAQLLAFSRKQILQPQVLDINEVLGELQPMLERLLDDNIEVRVFPADGAHNIRADHGQIQQVLLNLVVNARDAMPEGGVLTLEARSELVEDEDAAARLDLDVGAYVILTVSDTGVGMDAETRERIFEPFFTTKGPGSGTGLGLATVFGIVRQSGGSIWVYSEEGFGTTFKIYFPATDSPAESRPPRSSLPPGPVSGTILLVEDEEHLRAVVERVLARAGYDVLAASSPQQALEIAEHHDGGIDLLLTDVLMPGMTGRQVADGVQQHRPKTVVLFMSGYTENSIVHHGVLDTGVNFIPKPLTPARLLEAIGEALGGRADAG